MIAELLNRVATKLPGRHLFGRQGIYLSRFTVLKTGPVRVYLNRFWRGDEDQELHNHPWRWAVSLILSGGYTEERRTHDGCDYEIERRELRPGQLNLIGADTFHRLAHVEASTWTLFVAGPTVQGWGFWSRATRVFTPWPDFIRAKGLPLVDEGWTTDRPEVKPS